MMKYNVAVLGASAKPERYSYKAVKLLADHGYAVFPVHPSGRPIDGLRCFPRLDAIEEKLDTITIYLGQNNSTPLIEEIIKAHPRRVILNPGAENDTLASRCKESGIEVQQACTLVLLSTGQF
ncbi:CoA-binding protein [bacterium]|nr:CoA-binding protein [bacterium]